MLHTQFLNTISFLFDFFGASKVFNVSVTETSCIFQFKVFILGIDECNYFYK